MVGNEAFNHCRELREVVIPEGVEELGAWAFNHCDALEKIHLPASLVKLDKKNQPFNNCYDSIGILLSGYSNLLTVCLAQGGKGQTVYLKYG